MLVELDIKNFAIIKSLKVRFQEKMTVIIGETGAGKSIIIDAVSLLMGGRGQKEMIRSGEKKAVITGLFELDDQKEKIAQLCDQYGLPHDDDQLVISRELAVKGRNVVRINGQLTTINVLRDIGHYLVDIHGQHDQQILMDQDRQIDLVDNYAPASFKDDLADYQADFEKWQKLTNQLRHLRQDAQELAQKQDILQFQNNELESADLEDPEEDEKLEEEYNELNNYQKIADTANYFMQLYDDDEHGIATLLGDAQNAATDLTEFGSKFKDFAKTVDDGVYALNDARLLPAELNKIILVGGSSRIPAVQDKIKEVTGITPSKSLNPDECVAMGAGIQGGKLSGDVTAMGNYDVLLLDVTPLTLSIETVGGVATPLIDRNTPIPTSHSQIFTTSANFQTQVEINVLQGERPLAKDNKSLGKFKLKKIKRAMRGVPQIEVTFDIDVNGIVSVSAKDLASGNMQSITIENSSHMSDADIERAIHEAQQFEQQDAKTKERLVFKNDLETLMLRVDNALAKHHKEIDKTIKSQIKNDLSQLKKMTKKVQFETCPDAQFQEIKEAKQRLEDSAAFLLTMGE